MERSPAERGGGERSRAERSRAPWSPAKASRAQPREAERQESAAARERTKGAGVRTGRRRKVGPPGASGGEKRRGGERWGRGPQSWSHGSPALVTLGNWGAGGRRRLWNLVFPHPDHLRLTWTLEIEFTHTRFSSRHLCVFHFLFQPCVAYVNVPY